MEKRLFLAVLLSLGVVFVFQAFFGPKPGTVQGSPSGVSNVALNTAASFKENASEPAAVATPRSSFKEDVTSVDLGQYALDISNRGGNIERLRLKGLNYEFPINSLAGLMGFYNNPFMLNKLSDNTLLLSYRDSQFVVSRKIIVNGYKIRFEDDIQNVSNTPKKLNLGTKAIGIDLSRLDKKMAQSDWTLFEYGLKVGNHVERKEQARNFSDKWNKQENKEIQWISFRDRYFALVVQPNVVFKSYSAQAQGDKQLTLKAGEEEIILEANGVHKSNFIVYAGPQKLEELKEVNPDFQKVFVFSNWGWLDAIAKAIYWLLGVAHKLLPVWGLCIILVSLIVYGVMYPLTYKSMISMKKMQAVQPKINQLKEKYKNNPEKLNKEIVELYKQENINPLSGCLPLLFQMPIFVGLYQVLWRSFYFRGEGFLWIKDLSMPDRLFKMPFEIPFLGEYVNILPILMIGTMLAQQLITLKNMTGGDPEQVAQQKMMAYFFPVFLGFVFYNFSSGLNIYFVVFYSLSAFNQWKITRPVAAGK